MTSASEFEASLCLQEEDPPDIRDYNANIREERWTHFSLEGVRFPAMTVDVIQRGEALAVFERDLIIHFQQISRAAALYVRALLGGVKRTLEVYRRVDDTTKNYPWSALTTEEKWHSHAEGALMVALSSLNLPAEAWKSARILRAIPNCRFVLMMSYHFLSPALSVEENGLMAYLQTPPEAGPSVTQVTTGLQSHRKQNKSPRNGTREAKVLVKVSEDVLSKEMLENHAREPHPQIYSVKSVEIPEPPDVVFTTVPRTQHFVPSEVRKSIMKMFENLKPTPNANRGRLSNVAVSLTFGAQTGRGSDRSCVIRRTLEPVYQDLISKVHEMAQNAAGAALPYLGIQILKLEAGQELNQHRDYHNHPDYPNHTMKFGSYSGGSLQMLRYGRWDSYDVDNQWLSFDALKFVHRVQPVTKGDRYSITLYTPGKLERLTAQDWDNLAKAGFPIYLYEPLPARMRRLATPTHVMKLTSEAKKTQFGKDSRIEAKKQSYHRSEDALIDHFLKNEDPLWEDIPLPSVADPQEENLLRPKSLLEHCTNAREFMDEFDLNDGLDNHAIELMRVRGHMTRMIGYFQAMLSHAESNDRHGYLWTLTSMFRLVCVMANEAELAPILSVACSLKHVTDMKKTFLTQNEAFDKAKQLGLTPDQAAREVTQTPHGRFTLYDAQKGEIAKPDTWKPPDFRSLIQAAGTEAGKSELSCVLDDTRTVVMARPMILSDETRPSDYTFAHCVATLVQTDDVVDESTPDELAKTSESHLWLANLEISSGIAPAMSTTSQMPGDPHPDGPTTMTWHQLEDAQQAIVQGHRDRSS